MLPFFQKLTLGVALISMVSCASLSGSSSSSDETDTEAAFTSAVETLIDSNSSSSDNSSSIASLTTNTSYLASGQTASLKTRYHCEDSASASETFNCDNATGAMTRTITFEDCALSNSVRDVVLNGSFTNTVTNGGDGMCEAGTTIDFSKVVKGRDDDQANHLDAVHQHDSGSDAMVYTFTNQRGKDVTVTRTSTRTITYTNPVDANADGSAESVTSTVDKEFGFVHTVDGAEVHNMTVFTTDTDFTSTTVDADTQESTSTTVEVSLPVHTVTFDDEGEMSGRTIESGHLIVDHNVGKTRLVFSVGDEGLTFDDGTTCGPVSGTMTVVGYTINDDDTIGEQVGTGTIVFEDGEVQSSVFDGEQLTLRPRPCN